MDTMKNSLLFALIFLLFLFGCATQDDVYVLDNRLASLEQQNRALEKQNRELIQAKSNLDTRVEGLDKSRQTDEVQLREQYASLHADILAMQEQVQLISGRLEETEYLLKKQQMSLKELQVTSTDRMDQFAEQMAKAEDRMNKTDNYIGLETTSKTDAPLLDSGQKKSPESEKKVKVTDKTLYAESKRAFDLGEYEKAKAGFRELIKSFPKSRHADNSQFWIGEIYYREKWYEKAILEYQVVIEKYPKGNKVPAALLKQGLAFVKIGDKGNARLIFKELGKKYPKSNEGKIAKQKLKEL